jgi:hypothetical protein
MKEIDCKSVEANHYLEEAPVDWIGRRYQAILPLLAPSEFPSRFPTLCEVLTVFWT